jgi:Zn-dependent M16 (insulinase) family peptidase
MEYMTDCRYEDKCEILSQILSTDKEDLRKAIDIFRYVNEDNNVCVIGNRAALEKCGEKLNVIFDLNNTK